MDDAQAQLIAEQLRRISDGLNARVEHLEELLRHQGELENERNKAIRELLSDLRDQVKDHEQRIRAATDGVTTFRVWSGLATGGSSIMAVIAFVKSFLP